MALFNLADMKLMVVSVADQIKGATGGQVWSDGVVMVHADSHAVHQEALAISPCSERWGYA